MKRSLKEKRDEAIERNEAHRVLTTEEKIAKARGQIGDSVKVLTKLGALCLILTGCLTQPSWLGGPASVQKPTKINIEYAKVNEDGSSTTYKVKGSAAAGVDLSKSLLYEEVVDSDGIGGSVHISGSGTLNTEAQAQAAVGLAQIQADVYKEVIPATIGAALDAVTKYMTAGVGIPGGTPASSPPGNSVTDILRGWMTSNGARSGDIDAIMDMVGLAVK